MSKNIHKILNSKYSQKIIDHAKQPVTVLLKTASKRMIQKTAEATADLIRNKIGDKIARASRVKLYQRIIQKKMKNEYLEKDIYLQKKDRKLLMI